ncbi:WD40 repeat-like protein [Hypoxylon trugodes]|uniref:WD40 repeat-like protein n=1 Tax=Hypoxylon trugodes TaxID=326681 RepID=UPI00218CC141|nr:WD40 repeat-like protein [Hypoxylon trugodes]KAI1391745.1 WD40 repeat-like protein [Hypoxylon trugodes]
MATPEAQRQYVPLTCHGHSRPVPHISFSPLEKDDMYWLISACKDGNPMLRDGQTGDWIGTFIGHKGAVWQARLSPDASTAATASADFTAKIWDTHTGELLFTLQHDHIVRAVAYPPDNSDLVATGGMEKKLRIFDLTEMKPKSAPEAAANGSSADAAVVSSTIQASSAFEIGAGIHTGSIKFIVWTKDPNILITASDNTLRWFDLPTRSVVKQEVLDGEIGSCEFSALAPEYSSKTDIGEGLPVLAVAAGKSIYFWGGFRAMDELKRSKMNYKVASVAVDPKGRRIVVGEDIPATWARVYRWDDDAEIDIHKGHHGPVWSVAFSPDGKLYATGSEDGTIKMWKNCEGFYGLWRGGANVATERSAE